MARKLKFTIAFASLFYIYCMWYSYRYHFTDEFLYCGKILYKSERLHNSKHTTYNQTFFVVDYGNDVIKDVQVTTYTYLNKKEGDEVCFYSEPALSLIGMVLSIAICISLLMSLIYFLIKDIEL